METTHEYKFKIDAFTPATLPMSRLAGYMQDLAALIGEKEYVHFVRLDPGSTMLVHKIDRASIPKVHARLTTCDVAESEGPEDTRRAFKALDRRLAEDNTTGHLYQGNGAEILYFPGCKKPKPLTFGAFTQPGSLDGQLIRIGGRDETVPVHLQEGDAFYKCNATRDVARRLAPHLYAAMLRVHGNGRWERDAEGNWDLTRFNIAEFEVLEDTPLGEVVARLRRVPGSGWEEIDDPYAELQRLRQGPEEAH